MNVVKTFKGLADFFFFFSGKNLYTSEANCIITNLRNPPKSKIKVLICGTFGIFQFHHI